MPKRTAAHRGRYKTKSKPTVVMPLLLRRALAQLRGDPPESWPNALRAEQPAPGAHCGPELYGPAYPFPTITLPILQPGWSAGATKVPLRQMLARLQDADIGDAWRTLNARYAARKPWPSDAGLDVLLTLIEGLTPINLLDSATVASAARGIKDAARSLVSSLEAFASAGAPLHGIMPIRPTDLPGIAEFASTLDAMAALGGATFTPRGGFAELLSNALPAPSATLDRALRNPDVLLALLRSLAERELGHTPQRRGSPVQRQALTIARRLQPLAGAATATAIANAATGARITAKALTKMRN
jgi:hypothetical protein